MRYDRASDNGSGFTTALKALICGRKCKVPTALRRRFPRRPEEQRKWFNMTAGSFYQHSTMVKGDTKIRLPISASVVVISDFARDAFTSVGDSKIIHMLG